MENLSNIALDNEREWFECVAREREAEEAREFQGEIPPCDDDLADCECKSDIYDIDIGAMIKYEKTRLSYNEFIIKSLVAGGAK